MLFELVPEMRGRAGVIARALLPGPYTLVLPNPARRFSWLTGSDYDTIGVRVPELKQPTRGGAATRQRRSPRRARTAGAGPIPVASRTFPRSSARQPRPCSTHRSCRASPRPCVDFSEREPRVLREGAASGAEAIRRALEAVEN